MNTQIIPINPEPPEQLKIELKEWSTQKALWLKDNWPITREQFDNLVDEISKKCIECKAKEFLYNVNHLSTVDELCRDCRGVRYKIESNV